MKRYRKGVKLMLLGLIAGGTGVLFISSTSFTSLLVPHRRVDTLPSDQIRREPSVQELLETTYLGHAEEYPDPGEPAVVLKKYVERDTHKYLEGENEQGQDLDREIAEWEMLVRDHPQSRHALARLAELYRNKAELTQDKGWSRKAADLYIQAAEIGLSHGRIRYTRELSELLVELADKAGLDEIFEAILAQPRDGDHDHYYRALVDYGDGLAQLNDIPRAWGYFEDAIDFHPEQNVEAINRYARYLLDQGQAQQAFDILDTRLTSEARAVYVMPAFLRKEAMQRLGMDVTLAEAETSMVRQRVIDNGGSTAVILPERQADSETDQRLGEILKSLFAPAAEAAPFYHSQQSDDCRDRGWQYSLCDAFGNCFTPNAINLAEIIYNEAQGEKQGARYSVGWTVKNRAFQTLNPQCDTYPGGAGWGDLSLCFQGVPSNDPNYPTQSQQVCCAIHGGTTLYNTGQSQWNDTHRSFSTLVSSGTIYAAWYVLDGFVPDMSTGWIPPGVSGCNSLNSTDACGPVGIPVNSYGLPAAPASAGPWCQYGSNFFDPSPNGPMEFRSCAYTPTASSCKWYARDVCGNTATDICGDPAGSDNHFWNRKGPSLSTPIGYFDGIDSNYFAWGWALDPDTSIAPIDIHIYIDGPAGGGGTFVAGFPANQPRADVNQVTGYPGDHGWSWVIPSQYRTAPHTYYAYALDQTGTYNPQLSSSPRTR